MDLADLRQELERIDRGILEAAAERQRLARRIEEVKAAAGRPIRDFQREREVLSRTEETARRLGLDPALARELLERLIESSLAAQEQQRVESSAGGNGRRALVIGGAGRMGAWFGRFLASQGWAVEVADPAPSELRPSYADWREATVSHDLVVIATPLRVACEVLAGLAARRPPGVVLELGSLKSPLAEPLGALVAEGVDAVSIHPLFGPDVAMLSGRHVVLVDLGRPRATALARELFASTMAELVEMDLEEHDRLMAWILGLSHAVNLAFIAALESQDLPICRLASFSSSTFQRQLEVAARVARENPHLYFEIQHLNRHAEKALDALRASTERLHAVIGAGDEDAFVELMERGLRYLSVESSP